MNIRKMIKMLIVGLAVIGFTSTSMAFTGNSYGPIGIGSEGGFGAFGGFEGYGVFETEETTLETAEEEETVAEAEPETNEKEQTTSETAEEEEIVAEAESETEPIEEEEYTDEETI